ncbi:hypothetical protein [Streptomyces sp. NPDC058092]|uniref:hypothetical protein n=1 Tax=Streptomyces sp. NPDC058092 TaxID=3346336 RepID=UPI0036E5F098
MNLNSAVSVALIAAVVSILGTLLTVRATTRTNRNSVVQTQIQEILKKRIELYPQIWKTCIRYEVNWEFTNQDKTREWAERYAQELNEFNLECGVFFSQAVYKKFFDLRELLHQAIDETPPGIKVSRRLVDGIRGSFYGDHVKSPGLSTLLKDDLGSYQDALLARRSEGR